MTKFFPFFLLALFAMVSLSAAEPGRPNVILILADDLGYGDLSCYGQKHFHTPRIDSLAEQGVKFTQFYAGSTVCAPSRCALMTGFHTGHAAIRGNRWNAATRSDWPLPDESVTVAKVFKNAGYATGLFGKWGLGAPESPLKQGFDEFFGYSVQVDAHNYYPPFLYDGTEKIPMDGKTYSHDLIEDRALAFLRKNKDKPFFCYIPVTIPHAAMQVPEEYVAPWREKFASYEDIRAKYSSAAEVRNPVAAFPGMITRLDETVGKILDTLKELDIDENTIVFFTSDNGPHKEGGHDSTLFESYGPLRGFKRDLTEGGIRVPLLVRWPAVVKGPVVSDHVGAFWDFLPTVCELVGQPEPEGIDGVSFAPTLLGDAGEQKSHEYLYWEFYEQGGKVAARWRNFKGIRLNVGKAPDGPIAVYDLSNDLKEQTDIAESRPDLVEKFRQIFEKAHSPSDVFQFR